MGNYELKTRANDGNVLEFINSVENKERREDGVKLLEMYERLTGEKGRMWGPSIIGFGEQKYKYPDGREMDWMAAAFSPRKQNLTLYVICGSPKQPELLKRLGKHSTGVSCLYIKRLSDIDIKVLEKIIADACKYVVKSGGSC